VPLGQDGNLVYYLKALLGLTRGASRYYTPIIAILAGVGWVKMLRSKKRGEQGLGRFALMAVILLFSLHCVYYWQEARLLGILLPFLCLMVARGITAVRRWILRARTRAQPMGRWTSKCAGMLLVLSLLAQGWVVVRQSAVWQWSIRRSSVPVPARRLVAEFLDRSVSPDACIISGIDPVYLQFHVLAGTDRTYLAISRGVRYAGTPVGQGELVVPGANPEYVDSLLDENVLVYVADDVFTAGFPEYVELTRYYTLELAGAGQLGTDTVRLFRLGRQQ